MTIVKMFGNSSKVSCLIVDNVTKIDPYVIAELSYWRSHWPSWPDSPIPAFLLDDHSDVTGLWSDSINTHAPQHLSQVRLHQHYRLSAEKLPCDCDDYSSRSSSPSK